MKVQVKKRVGSCEYVFETESEKPLDALFVAGFLSETPEICSLCGSEKVRLTSNKAGGYTFVKVRCEDCGGQANVGSYKDGGYFWKKFERWEKEPLMDVSEQSEIGNNIPF
jgi:hypothetical protein